MGSADKLMFLSKSKACCCLASGVVNALNVDVSAAVLMQQVLRVMVPRDFISVRDLPSLSVKALAEQKAAGVPSRLVGVVVPSLPREADNIVVWADGVETGEITSHCFSERYDAWLSFVILDSPVIDCVKADGVNLAVRAGAVEFDAVLSELHFVFDALSLPPRVRPS